MFSGWHCDIEAPECALMLVAAGIAGSVLRQEEAFACSGSVYEACFGSQQGHLA